MHAKIPASRLLVLAATTFVSSNAAVASDGPSLWGLEMVGGNHAFEKGYTGVGVKVGVMDQAARSTHHEFADRWMGSFNVDGSPYGPTAAHGTHVSGTIAGKHVGVAPGSLLYGINWSVLNGDTGYANGYRWGLEQGVRLFSNSWGLDLIEPDTGIKRSVTVNDMSQSLLESTLPHTLSALADSAAAGSVQVFATGNDAMIQPNILASLPYYYRELQPHWIAVTAVGPTGSLASYANMCGVAAAWCMTAPGGDGPGDDGIWSAGLDSDDYYMSMNGTSMATPHVSGAVAVAAQMFPDATYSQLAQLVLQTATDLGEPGIDPVYGWGLLNIGNMVDTIDPRTAGLFANAAWARFATLGHISNVLQQRLTAPIIANYSGHSAFELLGYAIANPASTRGSVSVSTTAKPDIWIAPVYGTASIASSPTSFGATSILGGLVIGADILNSDNARFGLALGYTNTLLESDKVADRGNANGLHLGAYAGWEDNNWFVKGTGQAAFVNQSIERHAIAGATGISFDPVGRSRLSGTGLDLSVQAGHHFDVSERFTITPYLSLGARWQSTSATSEADAGMFGLTLPATTYGQFEGGPGLRVESAPLQIDGAMLRLAGDISYARLDGNTNNATSTIMLGRSIEGRSAEPGRNILRVGAEFNLATSKGHDWFALYRGSFQQRATSHTLGAGVKISF